MNKKKMLNWKRLIVAMIVFSMLGQNMAMVWAAKDPGDAIDGQVQEQEIESPGDEIAGREETVTPEVTPVETPALKSDEEQAEPAQSQVNPASGGFLEEDILEAEPEEEISALGATWDGTISLSQFLTNFQFTDGNGTPFGPENPVQVYSTVKIRYDFTFPNGDEIKAGATFTIKLPEEIYIDSSMQAWKPLPSSGPAIDAEWQIDSDGTIRIRFNSDVTASNLTGFVEISGKVDRLKVTEETIEFDLGQYEGQSAYPAEPIDEEKRGVDIKKTLSYYASSGRQMRWDIRMTPNEDTKTLAGFTVYDTFDPDQMTLDAVYLDESSSANGLAVTLLPEGGFSYTFPENITPGNHILIVITSMKTDFFLENPDPDTALSDFSGVPVKNSAEIFYNDQSYGKSEASVNNSIRKTKIAKTQFGEITEDGKVTYVITANQQHMSLSNGLTIIDRFPYGLKYVEETSNVQVLHDKTVVIPESAYTITHTEAKSENEPGELKFIIDYPIGRNTEVYVTFEIDPEALKELKADGNPIDGVPLKYNLNNKAEVWVKDTAYGSVQTPTGIDVGFSKQYLSVKKTSNILTYRPEGEEDNSIQSEWEIVISNIAVNKEHDIVFKDTLPTGQTYVPGTFKVDGAAVPDTSVTVNGQEISYTFTAADKEKDIRTITFEVITDLGAVSAADNKNGYVKNIAKVEYDLDKPEAEGIMEITESARLAKTGSYAPDKEEFIWTILVNSESSVMNLTNAVITDTLPENHEIAGGLEAIEIYDGGRQIKLSPEEIKGLFDISQNGQDIIIKAKAGVVLDTYYEITFSTRVKEGIPITSATNNVTLKADETMELKASAHKDVSYDVPVIKKSDYQSGDIISWYVEINRLKAGEPAINILKPNSKLIDDLPIGLEYVPGSISLKALARMSSSVGDYWEDYTVVSGNAAEKYVSYDPTDNRFTFTLHEELFNKATYNNIKPTSALRLYFNTKVVKNISNVSNECTFDNIYEEKTSEVKELILKDLGAVAGIEGDNLIFKINKTGEDDEPLGKAEFTLYQADGETVVSGPTVTTANGIIRFTEGLQFDHTYILRETKAPDGYDPSAENDSYKIIIGDGNKDSESVAFTVCKNDVQLSSGNLTKDINGYFVLSLDIKNEIINVDIGNLEIQKTVAGVPENADQEFTFTVTLTDENDTPLTEVFAYEGVGGKANGTITNGGQVTLKNGESVIIRDIPEGSKYQVEETSTAGYVVTPAAGIIEGGITKDVTAKAAFTNTAAGNLKVSKTVAGSPVDTTKEFTFTVVLTDGQGTPLTQTFVYEGAGGKANGTITNGGQVKLKHGEAITIKDIPAGSKYQITESSTQGYVMNPASGTIGGNITQSVTAEAAFTNTAVSGLTISKTVTGSAKSLTEGFTFTVTLKDTAGEELTGSYSYTGSQEGSIQSGGTVTLKHGESITITGLPHGTKYTVEEDDSTGYTVAPASGKIEGTIAAENPAAAFTNHKDTEDVKIRKVDITGEDEVAGAELTIYEKASDGGKGDVVESWTSGTGVHTVDGSKLEAGKSYILEETNAPDGYAYAAEIEFSVKEDGTIQVDAEDLDKDGNVVMVDKAIRDVEIRKTDITGTDEITGAGLTVYEKASNGSKGTVVDSWTSDGSAHTILGSKFKAGQEYILEETATPNGYQYASDITFKVEQDGSVTVAGFPADVIVMKDAELGDLGIAKRDITGQEEVGGAVLTLYEENSGLKGAVVDCWTSNGSTYYISADKLKSSQGYILEETYTAPGYLYAADIAFALDENGALKIDSGYLDGLGNIVMKDKPVTVTFKKTDVAGSEVEGATLTIYKKNTDGSKGAQVTQWVSTKEVHEVKALLEIETEYILEETSAPDGYAYASEISFRMEKDGSVTVLDGKTDDDGNIVMVDEAIGDVEIRKTDITGIQEVAGAELTIYEKASDGSKGTVVASWTSDGTGAHTIPGSKFKAGQEYILEETAAPDGYQYASDITFKVEQDGSISIAGSPVEGAIVMKDAELGDLGIAKRDITGQEEVFGAVLTLYKENSGTKGAVVESWTSDGMVHYIAAGKLKAGQKYILEETSTAPGYLYAADIAFELDKEGTLVIDSEHLDDQGNIVMKDEPVTVTFKKTDVAGAEVEGATLTIYKKNTDGSKGDQVTQWVSTKKTHEVKALLEIETEYILEETNAPNGYAYTADISFYVDVDGIASVTDGPEKDIHGNIVMIDEVIEVRVSKVNTLGMELSGASLTIYEADAAGKATKTKAKDKDGNELTWVTTGEPKDITGIPAGTYVLHEEAAPRGYYVAYDILFTVNADGTVTKDSATGDIDGNTIIMTDLKYGEVMPDWVALVVKKTVTGTAGDQDQEFTFTLKLTYEDGEEVAESFPYGGSKTGMIKSGESVKLKHGESINIYEIPLDVQYAVIESDNEGYTVTEKNTAGIIDEVGRTAQFTNHKDKPDGGNDGDGGSKTPQVKNRAGNNKTNYPMSRTFRTVKTGDMTNWFTWIILCAVCVLFAGGLLLLKKRRHK